MPIAEPLFINTLTVQILDYDISPTDDVLATKTLFLKDIKEGFYEDPFWCDFYGMSSDSDDPDVVKKMTIYDEICTNYNGSVLMRITHKPTTIPNNSVQDMEYKWNPVIPTKQYLLVIDICDIFNIRSTKEDKYELFISCGPYSNRNKGLVYNRGMLRVNKRIEIVVKECRSIRDVGEVIVMLKKNKINFGFVKFDPAAIYIKDSYEYEFISLKVDRSINLNKNTKNEEIGFIRIRCRLFDIERGVPREMVPPQENPKLETCNILINLYSARNLPSSDPDGLADPEVYFFHFGATSKSKVVRNSIDPIWCERILLNSYKTGDYFYPIVTMVYDRDESTIGRNVYEFMGMSLVHINHLKVISLKDINTIEKPRWYPLENRGIKMGKVLMTVQITEVLNEDRDRLFTIIRPISSVKENYKLKVYILGLRNLLSDGIFDIKKPTIKMNIGALKEGNNSIFGDIYTAVCNTGGSNPTFNSIIS